MENMIQTGMFDQKEICEYEEKTGNGKNWTNTKKYFITLIKQKQQYTKTLQSYQGGGYEKVPTVSGRRQA